MKSEFISSARFLDVDTDLRAGVLSPIMSQPSPEAYEQGRGMDAHNAVMRDVRAERSETYDPTEPTRVWMDEDNTPDGVVNSLTIILNTGGCRWARAGGCTMCGYVAESVRGATSATRPS